MFEVNPCLRSHADQLWEIVCKNVFFCLSVDLSRGNQAPSWCSSVHISSLSLLLLLPCGSDKCSYAVIMLYLLCGAQKSPVVNSTAERCIQLFGLKSANKAPSEAETMAAIVLQGLLLVSLYILFQNSPHKEAWRGRGHFKQN